MKLISTWIIAALCAMPFHSEATAQPNIVLLFADDAGYADFGFQGSRTCTTPNLDQLAKAGVRLSQFYVTASVCGPSRAGMMTGKYQQRFGFEENNVPGIMSASSRFTGEEMGLPLEIPTLGDYLRDLGYRTAIFGKWHLGEADRYHPLQRGFDEFFGFRGGARSYFPYPPNKMPDRGRRMERGFLDFAEPEGYLTDVLADETCAFIDRNEGNPFFVCVSFNAVHTPMEPDPKDKNAFPQLSGKRRQVAQMGLSLDRACGHIVNKLEVLGLDRNTLIVFTNDNGGPTDANESSNYPLSGTKATHLEGGIRVPCIIAWPGMLAAGTVYDHPASTLDLLPTFVSAGGGDPTSIEGLDGVDLVPYLQGMKTGVPHQTLYWKKENRGAIRDGEWKMMRFPDRPAELYNLTEDPSEQNNLAAAHPEMVRTLYKRLFAWELELERPLFQLRRAEEQFSADCFDRFRIPVPEKQ